MADFAKVNESNKAKTGVSGKPFNLSNDGTFVALKGEVEGFEKEFKALQEQIDKLTETVEDLKEKYNALEFEEEVVEGEASKEETSKPGKKKSGKKGPKK